jgi:hypothetical protein
LFVDPESGYVQVVAVPDCTEVQDPLPALVDVTTTGGIAEILIVAVGLAPKEVVTTTPLATAAPVVGIFGQLSLAAAVPFPDNRQLGEAVEPVTVTVIEETGSW